MLKVQLSKPDGSHGEWLQLPAEYDRIRRIFTALADEEHPALLITAAETDIAPIHQFLVGKYVEQRRGIRDMDFLTRRIEGFTEQEKAVFGAALEIEQPSTIMEMANLSCNLDKFAVYPKVQNEAELGEYLLNIQVVDEQLLPYVDRRKYGRDYALSHAGAFCESGYIVRTGEALKPVYTERNPPDPGYAPNSLFLLRLYSSHYADSHPNTYSLSLPATEEKMELARKNLGVNHLEECSIIDLTSQIRDLESHLPYDYSIDGLNDFARLLGSKVLDGAEETVERLCAVLTAEIPETIQEASEIAENLNQYTILPDDIRTPEEYAHHVLQEADIHINDEIYGFVDFEGFGKARMQRDGGVSTVHGMVLRKDYLLRQLPEELVSLKLFSPLYPQLYERNEWGDLMNEPTYMGTDELCDYQDEILAAIERECLDEEGNRGLAVYLDNELLKRKVFSMNPTVEKWDGRLWGVLEVQSYGALSDAEMKGVMEEWSGQESDGWGEGFEQREIKIEAGELCISFWSSDRDFFIKTEQELKHEQSQNMEMQMGGM